MAQTKDQSRAQTQAQTKDQTKEKHQAKSVHVKRRTLAIQVLTQVLGSSAVSFDQALDLAIAELPAESAWLTDVCAGVLRWKGRLDWAIDSVADRKKPSGRLRKALLVGAYQLIVQDKVPPAWVVSETVDWIKIREGVHTSKFANASLRKVAASASRWREWEFPAEPQAQAAWASLPLWLWKFLIDQRGLDWAKGFALASLERPKVWLRMKSAGGLKALLASPQGNGACQGPTETAVVLDPQGRISELPGFQEGEFIVQDLSSQMAVETVFRESQSRLKTCLDLCAAPGGKAISLSWRGLEVVATDQNEARLDLLASSVARVKTPIQVLAQAEVASDKKFDLVWVDAPCSSSGLLRRHPDIRWGKDSSAPYALNQVQLDLLSKGSSFLHPESILAYSVCSVFFQEGKGRVSAFLGSEVGARFELVGQWEFAPHDSEFSPDGFYLALLRQKRAV